jgi:hypothetical protein
MDLRAGACDPQVVVERTAREVLADQQVGPASRAGRVVGTGELHQHVLRRAVVALPQGGELRELAARRRTRHPQRQGFRRQPRIGLGQPRGRETGRRPAGGGVPDVPQPPLAGRRSHQQVAGGVVPQDRQHVEHVVVRPVRRIVGDLERRRVMPGEIAAQESLRPHVLHGIGQSFEPAGAHRGIERPARIAVERQRHAVGVDRVDLGDPMRHAGPVDPEQRQRRHRSAQRAPGGIAGAPRASAHDDAVPRRPHGTTQGGSADAQALGQPAGGQGALETQ